jgi:hypothetical protein
MTERLNLDDISTAVTVARTGKVPLRFHGVRLGIGSSRSLDRRSHLGRRWHDVAVYRTSGGNYVASVVLRTDWHNESDMASAERFDAIDAAVAWLNAYDPRSGWRGFPPGPRFAIRQEQLTKAICDGYRQAVALCLADIPEAAETVD